MLKYFFELQMQVMALHELYSYALRGFDMAFRLG